MTTDPLITINTGDFTASADRQTSIVTYADNLTPEQAIEHVQANLDKVPYQVGPIVEWAMTAACRKVLLKKGGIGEEWFTAVPITSKAARTELAPFGTVDKYGFFYFDYASKMDALEWIKARADKGVLNPLTSSGYNFYKRNAHHYAVDLADLGMVIIEKPRRNYGQKPWLVRYSLPNLGLAQVAPASPNPSYFLPGHVIPTIAFGGERSTNRFLRTPGAMGYTCDAFYPNPNYHPDSDAPRLLRCHDPAQTRFTLADDLATYVVKRCPDCSDHLRTEAAKGATFEILSEEAIDVIR